MIRSNTPLRPTSTPKRPATRKRVGAVLALASALALVTLTSSSCKTAEVPQEAPAIGASLELAAGEVMLVTDGGATPLMSNTPLPLGATVQTGPGARALIRLSDGTRAFLRDETTVTLTKGLALDSGAVWIDAPPSEDRAGSTTTRHQLGAVEVSISAGGASLTRTGASVEIYVADGLAIVTSPGGRSEVDPGERALVEGEAAPSIEPVKFWDDWTGGMGDYGATGDAPWVAVGSVYAIDHMAGFGAAAQPLAIQRQNVEVAIDQQIAETEVEQVFFNPGSSDVEGWYWFTVPEDAMIVGFALESNGELVEAEVVERTEAAQIFEANIQRRVDPALLEWVDARTVRARIYPIPAAGTRRVVLRYQQLLHEHEGKLNYRYPMAAPVGRESATIEDFALELSLRGEMAERYGLATRTDARVEGRERNRVTMRRSGFTPRADFELELTRKHSADPEAAPPSVRLNRFAPGPDQADYLMMRWAPDIEFTATAAPKGELVVVVDTSAGSDPSEHQAKIAVAEALLRSLSSEDRFVLVGADLEAEVLYPEEGLAEATPEAISEALDRVAKRGAGGATDLGAIFQEASERVHELEQPAIVYIGDGIATAGEVEGEALAAELRQKLASTRARLFTVGVGRAIDEALLTRLAHVGGGEYLRVGERDEAVMRALELSAAIKTPTLTDVRVDLGEGLDDVFVSSEGKLARGEELRLLARTHHELPETVTIAFRFGGQDYERSYPLARDRGLVLDRLVPRLWARAYIDSLLMDTRGPEEIRGKVLTLGLDYGLMTPFSSFLALESDAAYRRADIERRSREFPVLTAAAGFDSLDGASAPRSSAAFEDSRPTILSMIGAAASAPFGCMPGPNKDQLPSRNHSEADDEDEDRPELDRRAQTRGPAPSASPMVDARLEPPAESVSGEDIPASEEFARQQGAGAGYRGLGVIELDAEAEQSRDRSAKLAAAGFSVPTPPAWVDEVTESELARGSLSGRARTLPSSVAPERSLACSDASTRSLGHRRRLWAKRLDRQTTMTGMLRVYEASRAACELRRWRDQRSYLDLLQARARTEAEIQLLLGHFGGDQDARTFLGQALLRRLLEPSLIAALNYAMYGGIESWWEVDRRVDTTDDPNQRLQILAAAVANAPGDPDGERRMISELVSQGQLDEAITRGLRLRDQGSLTPELVQIVGELLVEAERPAEAKRLFSELVEFAPESLANRQLLGDIFLRHGWYEDAYRQFELLVEQAQSPSAAIRLARAATGKGATADALGWLEKVQIGDGRPGTDDPRRHARFHIAAILAQLITGDAKLDVPKDKLEAELEALGLFEGAATWELLVWEDLGVDLTLASPAGARVQSDGVDAGHTGLLARQYTGSAPELEVRHAGLVPDRTIAWTRISIHWDGSAFAITESSGTIEAKFAQAEQPEPSEVSENEDSDTESQD